MQTALVCDVGLTCCTVVRFAFFPRVLPVVLQPLLGVDFHQIYDQYGLQQTEQHQSKDHDAVGR